MKEITKKQENFLDECTIGTWKLNQKTGLVDILGGFNCSRMGLSDFMGIEFGRVSVNFYCSNNNLVSLEGAPQKVGGYFYCSKNHLVSLKGAPQEVGGNFYCRANKLTSLEGAPQKVGGDFSCSYNQLVSLEGAPTEVDKDFYCHHNQLVSLEGAPKIVSGSFYCYNNQLVSLEDGPQKVGGDLNCDAITLRGCPDNLLDVLFFNNKKYYSLRGFIIEIANGLEPAIYLKKML